MPRRTSPTAAHARAARARLLARTVPLADGLAALLFPYAEVVVHDLASQTIVHLVNPLSRRKVGDATALDDITFGDDEGLLGPYEKANWDGGRMRAISVLVRDDAGTPIGVMCVNVALTAFEQARATLDLFVTGVQVTKAPDKLFRDDWQERILAFLHPWLKARNLTLAHLTREQKRELVVALEKKGAFRGKSAADYVATLLGMGRATVYNHLKAARSGAARKPA